MLGFILAPLGQEVPGQYPNSIQFTFGGNGSYLCPADPFYNTRGEEGFSYDSYLAGIGEAIPTDAELATVWGYTPDISGEVHSQEGYFPAPWIPPGGYNSAGAYGPQKSLSGASANGSTPTWLVGLVFIALGAAAWWGYKEFKKPVHG